MTDTNASNVSKQEKKLDEEQRLLEEKQLEEFKHFLQRVKNNPEIWRESNVGFLREFVEYVETNRKQYPPSTTDSSLHDIVDVSAIGEQTSLSTKFVSSLADKTFVNDDSARPILQVASCERKHDDGYGKDQKYKRTNLLLVDGDGNTVFSKLSTQLSGLGRYIRVGDIMRVDFFNNVAYRVNAASRSMPALLILKFCRLGNEPLPFTIENPLPLVEEVDEEVDDRSSDAHANSEPSGESSAAASEGEHFGFASVPNCCESNRMCSRYGSVFMTCICEAIPVEEAGSNENLENIAEDCFFANPPYNKKSNQEKRNILYWWYATNAYMICGKGNRRHLPDCLVYSIRKMFPEADGQYVGFRDYVPGRPGKRKRRRGKS